MLRSLLLTTFLLQAGRPASIDLRAQIERIARDAQGSVGAAILVVETGEAVSFHGDRRFPMQSVYKFPIAMAVLHDVDAGRASLDQKVRVEPGDVLPPAFHSPIRNRYPRGNVDISVRELLRLAVEESDGTASDVLLRLAGGPERVTHYLRELGVNGMMVATPEKAMERGPQVQYRNWSTPDGAVALLRVFQEGHGLAASSRQLLMGYMTGTSTGPQRLKGLLPEGTVVAHKTGTSGTSHGLTRATNDVGLITLPDGRHLAVAVFVADSKADESTRDRVIARISRAGWNWSTNAPLHLR